MRRRRPSPRPLAVGCWLLAATAGPAVAQIDLTPKAAQPTIWERFTLRVISQGESPTVDVTLTVPEIVAILGVQAPPAGWDFAVAPATDTTPQTIRWTGGSLDAGYFEEFAFLGRVPADARRKELVFPVTVGKADGTTMEWARSSGAGMAPVVQIVGTTPITAWGAVGLAGGAFGVATIALAIAMSRRRTA